MSTEQSKSAPSASMPADDIVAPADALHTPASPATLALGPRFRLDASRVHVMGILNVTPDSFSDGGKFVARDAALRHAEQLISDGADILDIGGESTRPGAEALPEDAELEEAWGAAKQAGDVETLRELAIGQWYADGADDYLREQMSLTMAADAAQGELEQEHPAHWEAVAGLGMPVTVIVAEKDPRDSLQASLDLAEKVPGARLVRLDTDHVPQYRMPAEVAAAVLG